MYFLGFAEGASRNDKERQGRRWRVGTQVEVVC